jgi:hypothetical protein
MTGFSTSPQATIVRDKNFIRKPGKTRKDKAAGAFAQNAANKAERAEWVRTTASIANWKGNPKFPTHTCNGRKTQALKRGK